MGFIADTIVEIRDATDEPATNAKYGDARLIRLISQAFGRVWTDINQVSRHKTVVRCDISVEAGRTVYALPPTAKRIIDIQYVDSAGTIISRYEPSSYVNPVWPGVVLEGSNLVFQSGYEPTSAFTLRLLYHPTGFVHLIYGTVDTIVNDIPNNECVLTLDGTPTGTLDLRPNAYAGCILRLLTADGDGAGIIQDRIIKTWKPRTFILTVAPHYETGFIPETGGLGGDATYEITPLLADELVTPVALHVARYIVGIDGDPQRYSLLEREYQRALRDVRQNTAHHEVIRGTVMNVVTARSPGTIRSPLGRLDGGATFLG